MYTKLYSIPNWRRALEAGGPDGAPSAADVDAAVLRQLSRGRVGFVPADIPAEAGCRVTLRTSSSLPRFNRERTVLTAGSGLFSAEIERALTGMRAGESARALVEGEPVDFTVLQVERRECPELTDALAREQGVEGVETLEQYLAYMADKLLGEYVSALRAGLCARLLAGAAMDAPDERDVRAVIDAEYAPLRERFLRGGEDLDKMSAEQWTQNFYQPELKASYEQIYPDIAVLMDTKSKADFYEKRRGAAIETLRECLVLGAALSCGCQTAGRGELERLRREMDARIRAVIREKGGET